MLVASNRLPRVNIAPACILPPLLETTLGLPCWPLWQPTQAEMRPVSG